MIVWLESNSKWSNVVQWFERGWREVTWLNFFFHIEIWLASSCIGTSVCRWQSYSLLATYHSQCLPANGMPVSDASYFMRLLKIILDCWRVSDGLTCLPSTLQFVNNSIFNLSWASVCMYQRMSYGPSGPWKSGLASHGLFCRLRFSVCFGSELSFRIKFFITLAFRQPHK